MDPEAHPSPHLSDYNPLAPDELADPYPTWARARSQCPVFQSEHNGLWYLTRHADVHRAVRDPATFSSAFVDRTFADAFPTERRAELDRLLAEGFPDTTRFLLTTDAPHHTARRRLAQVAFTPARVTALEPTINAVADALAEAMDRDGDAELMGEFAYPLTTRVISAILGLGDDLVPHMRQVSEDLLVLSLPPAHELTPAQCDDLLARVSRISMMHRSLTELVTERRHSPGDDVLSALVHAHVEDEPMLEDDDVIAIALELVLAGTDTTANLIAHAVISASTDPDLWQRLSSDPALTAAVVEETLRLRGSSKGLFRVTTRDVDIDGTPIPAGSMVQLLFGSANHDEALYPHPTEFRLDRPAIKRHLAFGLGTHFCLGAPLARAETRVALQQLSSRFPKLLADTDARLAYLPSPTTHTLAALPIRLGG